jgi:hypothetical protein
LYIKNRNACLFKKTFVRLKGLVRTVLILLYSWCYSERFVLTVLYVCSNKFLLYHFRSLHASFLQLSVQHTASSIFSPILLNRKFQNNVHDIATKKTRQSCVDSVFLHTEYVKKNTTKCINISRSREVSISPFLAIECLVPTQRCNKW